MTDSYQGFRAAGLATLGLAVVLACGGGDQPTAGGPTAAGDPARTGAPAAGSAHDGGNTPPIVERVQIEPSRPASGETVRAVVQARDPEGDDVHLRYEWRVKGRAAGGDDPGLLLMGASRGDAVEVVVTPSDGRAEGPAVTARVRVRNRAPELTAVNLEPAGPIRGGDQIVVHPQARDVDGDEIRFHYRWTVNGEPVDETGSVFPTARLRRGDAVRVTVTASDGDEKSESIRTPELRIANGPPRIVSEPSPPGEDGVFRYQVRAQDPDGDRTLRFSLQEAPPGMDIDPASGEIAWQPAETLTGKFAVRIQVDDLQGGTDTQAFEITLSQEESAPPAAPR